MKKTIYVIAAVTILGVSCSKKQIQDPITKEGLEVEMKKLDVGEIDFSHVYKISEREVMLADVAEFLNSSPDETGAASISKIGKGKGERYLVKINSDDIIISAPCESESEKCYSKSCVEETIKEIYSADREVIVEYEKLSVGRKITWTYQDC